MMEEQQKHQQNMSPYHGGMIMPQYPQMVPPPQNMAQYGQPQIMSQHIPMPEHQTSEYARTTVCAAY